MRDPACAFWRRLDRPGHDSATIERIRDGWALTGFAAFSESGITGVRYQLELADDFSTRNARIEGFRDGRPFAHDFRRQDGWQLDGRPIDCLDELIHLDFGFTPATNFQQLRHADLQLDEEADIPAAWFDIGESSLVRLPQHYRRVGNHRYQYDSPTASYSAILEIAPNGFVQVYPGLWEMEGDR